MPSHIRNQVFTFDYCAVCSNLLHMARPLRIEYDGALYHVTSRGNELNPSLKTTATALCFSIPWRKSTSAFTGSVMPIAADPRDTERTKIAGRPTLEKLFGQRSAGKTRRDRLIAKAVSEFGYSQMELASFLNLHYSTISRILANTQGTANVKASSHPHSIASRSNKRLW